MPATYKTQLASTSNDPIEAYRAKYAAPLNDFIDLFKRFGGPLSLSLLVNTFNHWDYSRPVNDLAGSDIAFINALSLELGYLKEVVVEP